MQNAKKTIHVQIAEIVNLRAVLIKSIKLIAIRKRETAFQSVHIIQYENMKQ